MKKAFFYFAIPLMTLVSCGEQPAPGTDDTSRSDNASNIKEEAVTYNSDTTTLKGFIVYNASSNEKRPAVLVVPEWWGVNDYTRSRARQLAELGYVAMAVDFYGNGA